MSAVLGSTESQWKEIFAQAGKSYQPPTLVMFSEATRSGCGSAQAAMGPFYCPIDHKVYLDTSFFQDLQRRFRACDVGSKTRYDLKLAFKRMDNVTAEKGYAGPVVVCSVRYEAIAGHRASAPLVKYLSEGREIEVALAPAVGMHLLAPFRVSAMSMAANLVIEASRFETTAQSAGRATAPR